MRKSFIIYLFLIAIIGISDAESSSAASIIGVPSISPSQVISAINNYRNQNGVNALTTNDTLMSLAQGQSNYQAATGNISHTGPGGTTPKDRAYAAGYGNGNTIFLSEIIYGGYNVTVDDALTWWKGSSLHNRVMLDSRYVEIGAGVSTDGNWTYFTAELAWVSDYPAPADAGASDSSSNSEGSQDDSAPSPVVITEAEPREDGSIIHIVQKDQTLWAIAAVYDIDLDLLLAQNNLTRTSLIFPGDEILIRPATSSTATQELVENNTKDFDETPESSKPQAISTPVRFVATTSPILETTETTAATSILPSEETPENPSVRWVIIFAFAVIFLVIVGSLFFQKQPERPIDNDVVR